MPLTVLEQVVAKVAGGEPPAGDALAEAASGGIVVVDGDAVWFRHPLLAEVLAGTVPAPSADRVHDGYIAAIQATDRVPDLVRSALLALHHEAADHPTDAFVASLEAAEAAAEVFATAEESQHLERACRLWERVDPEVRSRTGDQAALLERGCRAALRAGRYDQLERLGRQAMAAVDPDVEPLRRASMHITLPLHLGDQPTSFEESRERNIKASLGLAEPHGPSASLMLARMNLALAKHWTGAPDALPMAVEAVEMAEAVGGPIDVAFAHLALSQFHLNSAEGLVEGGPAWERLREISTIDVWAPLAHMYLNCLEAAADWDGYVEVGLRVLADCTALGAPTLGAMGGSAAAYQLVGFGRYDAADSVLRELHTHRQGNQVAVEVRCAAVLLALRRGDNAQADGHLARVDELMSHRANRGTRVPTTRVEHAWTHGQHHRVIDLIFSDIGWHARIDPDAAQGQLVWANRAAADMTEARAASPAAHATSIGRLQQIEQTVAAGSQTAGAPPDQDAWRAATTAMLAAERARLADDPDQVQRWAEAGAAANLARIPWETAWAAYQQSRALLRRPGHRREAADALREAHHVASGLGAQPLLERVTNLAAQAHLLIDPPRVQPVPADGSRTVVAGATLTAREAEVLGHLVAGRTYGEIARDLFISEKTVSVHVSNLLHKTGTRSRVELAELAGRAGTT